jgi:TetR/AcrR family transcriptional regulator, lmrAB and yxaGH operons repressor
MQPTRTRMIEAAVEGLRRRGVAGMSFTEVLDASGAARGAIYHHFPGGKTQLVAEATRINASEVKDRFAGLQADTPVELVRSFLETVRPVVGASATGSGCAVAAVALGADATDPGLQHVAHEAFSSWNGALAERLTSAGVPAGDATALATTLLILLEGAHVLCRAAADIAPFDDAARVILAYAESRFGG